MMEDETPAGSLTGFEGLEELKASEEAATFMSSIGEFVQCTFLANLCTSEFGTTWFWQHLDMHGDACN